MDMETLLRAAVVIACRVVEAIRSGAQPGVGSRDEKILSAVLSYAEGIDRKAVGRWALRIARHGDDPGEVAEAAREFTGPVFKTLMAGKVLPTALADVIRDSTDASDAATRGIYADAALRMATVLEAAAVPDAAGSVAGGVDRWRRVAYLAGRPEGRLRRPLWRRARPGDVRAAALLNATGLGAGYFYLGLRTRGAIALGGTVIGLLLAAASEASYYPVFWALVASAWIAAAVIDVTRLHRSMRPLWGGPGRSSPRAVTAAAASLLLLVAGFLFFRTAATRAMDAADTAYRRGDCARAVEQYDSIATRYELALTSVTRDAEKRSWECSSLLSIEHALAAGDYVGAVSSYDYHLERYPHAAQFDRVRAGRATAYFGRAGAMAKQAADHLMEDARAKQYENALSDLRTVVTDFGATPQAAQVGAAVSTMFDDLMALVANGQTCPSVAAIEEFIDVKIPAADAAAQRARDAHPQVMYDCGVALHREGQFDPARQKVEGLISRYPDHASARPARALLTNIDLDSAKGLASDLGAPTVVGDAPAGSVIVEIVNDSKSLLRFGYRGPVTEYATVAGCRSCVDRPAISLTPESCGTGQATRTTVTLPPGRYDVVIRPSSAASSLVGAWELSAGTTYSVCVYMSKSILGR